MLRTLYRVQLRPNLSLEERILACAVVQVVRVQVFTGSKFLIIKVDTQRLSYITELAPHYPGVSDQVTVYPPRQPFTLVPSHPTVIVYQGFIALRRSPEDEISRVLKSMPVLYLSPENAWFQHDG